MARNKGIGSRNGNATLTEDEVRGIKMKLARGYNSREIAKSYGVGKETIMRIGRGDTWSWVPDVKEMSVLEQEAKRSQDGLAERMKAAGIVITVVAVEGEGKDVRTENERIRAGEIPADPFADI